MPPKRLLLFLFVLISLIFITYQSNRAHFQPLDLFNSMFSTLHNVKYSIKNSLTSPFKRMLLREEDNKKLRAEVARLLAERQKYHEALLENKRLKKLLSLKEEEPRYVTTAQVISKGTDQWSSIVTVNKGSSGGVKKDMTAITSRGLVGKITSVSGSYSSLLLITDINFSSAARLQRSRAEGVLSGTGFKKCKLKYVPYEECVETGEIIITSGLDKLFPEGIPIGYVSKVDKKGTGLFQDIEVLPLEDIEKIEEVVIIQRE